jgi:hypothetical protein
MVTKVLSEALLQLVSREEEEVERRLDESLWAATWTGGSVGRARCSAMTTTWCRGCIPNLASTTSRPNITCSGPMRSSGVSPGYSMNAMVLRSSFTRLIYPLPSVNRP